MLCILISVIYLITKQRRILFFPTATPVFFLPRSYLFPFQPLLHSPFRWFCRPSFLLRHQALLHHIFHLLAGYQFIFQLRAGFTAFHQQQPILCYLTGKFGLYGLLFFVSEYLRRSNVPPCLCHGLHFVHVLATLASAACCFIKYLRRKVFHSTKVVFVIFIVLFV